MSSSFRSNHELRLADLQEQLRRARAMTPDLMGDVVARACVRFQAQQPAVRRRVIRLIESGAFADATLALLELELPQWRLRRLIYDDGEWHCTLSQQPGLPAELDEPAEAVHEILSLAILTAFVEARRQSLIARQGRPNPVPQVLPARGHAVCCDNFA